MRRRSKALTTLAAFGLIGGVLAGTASASTPGTTPGGGSAAPGGEAAAGAGVGRGTDSGLDGFDLAGTTVTVYGIENGDPEGTAMQAALDTFAQANNMTITYTGSRTFDGDLGTMVQGGSPPDIGAFPQPGRLAVFAQSGDLQQIPDDILASASEAWPGAWMAFGNVDGNQFGVPMKSDLKSLMWYSPSQFAEYGYEVPTTFDDFLALIPKMAADGHTPLCVGIASDVATGWPYTDWVEDFVLRNQGIDYYNQWVAHEIPFNSPEIVADMQQVVDLWAGDNVYAAGGTIAATGFGDQTAQALVDGDCMMVHQASFFAANIANAGGTIGDAEGDLNYFYVPANEGHPTEVGGINAGAFRDAPEVWAVMQFLASADFANARQAAQTQIASTVAGHDVVASGFLTAVNGVDPTAFSELEQGFVSLLQAADPPAFDASDSMPGEVGSGTFWSESTSLVNGDETAQQAADNIEASWPTS